MSARIIYWTSDGAGLGEDGTATVSKGLHAWIVAQGDADLIVYGGDVYDDGTAEQFEAFWDEMGRDVSLMCETPGNHDWHTKRKDEVAGKIPSEYEAFWSSHPSRQPIARERRGGARYEHVIHSSEDPDSSWRLIFLDTGECNKCDAESPWPLKHAEERVAWLEDVLVAGGRRSILFAHHSRLSMGGHGDNEGLKALWKQLFDDNHAPRIALTVGGHDHNVSIYAPRDRHMQIVDGLAMGIALWVNGAGGASHSTSRIGTPPEFHNNEDYCVTKILIEDQATLRVQLYSFGNGTPQAFDTPRLLINRVYSFVPEQMRILDEV